MTHLSMSSTEARSALSFLPFITLNLLRLAFTSDFCSPQTEFSYRTIVLGLGYESFGSDYCVIFTFCINFRVTLDDGQNRMSCTSWCSQI